MIPHFLIRCALLVALTFGAGRFAGAADQEQLIAILQSGAPPADKALACKGLAIYGSKPAVAALAPLLEDEQLASWARIALEAIPDPAACDALRAAMGKLQGRLLIGVINSLGVRRDVKAAEALAGKLGDSDSEVASAAAVALGRIGGDAAVKVLEPALASAPAPVRSAIAEGCIYGAETFLTEGNAAEAARLYDAVRHASVNPQRKVEAMRGAILARGAAGVPLLVEQLRSPDQALVRIGLSAARELPGPEVARALLEEMGQAAPERKVSLLLVLADRGDAEALPAALQAARSGPETQRLVAIGLLERLGDASCVAPLLEIAAGDEPGLAQAAKSALTRLPGAAVDAAVAQLLKQADEKARLLGIELAAQRRLSAVVPDLMRSAGESNAALRVASLNALGEMGDEAEIQPLIDLLLKSQDTAPVETALSAIGSRLKRPVAGSIVIKKAFYGDLPDGKQADVTAKVGELVKKSTSVKASNANFGDPAGGTVKRLRVDYEVDGMPGSQTVAENQSITFAATMISPVFPDALCSALANAPAGARPALLRVLGSAGGAKALATAREAMTDADPGMREAAFGALCNWPGSEALGDLKNLVQTGADLKQKVLAMRGYVRIVGQTDLSTDGKLKALNDAMSFAPRDEERRLVLGALGGIRSPQAVKAIAPHLENPALKEEACVAAVSVAESFRRSVPAAVAEVMAKVGETTSNPELAKRAKGIAARAEGGAK